MCLLFDIQPKEIKKKVILIRIYYGVPLQNQTILQAEIQFIKISLGPFYENKHTS